jgi:transcription termination/antitermination protein NusG
MASSDSTSYQSGSCALPVIEDGVEWRVLHTKPRQEKSLADDLISRGIEHYLPLQLAVHQYGARRQKVELPLFPGYVFLRGTMDEAYFADRTKRVARILRVVDQSQFEWEIRNLRLALEGQATLNPFPRLVRGVRVEVRYGPLRGLQGIVEDRAEHSTRLILQIEMLGRAVSLDIDGSMVERID